MILFEHYYYGSAKDKPIIGNWEQFSAIRKRGGHVLQKNH
jgi:hypothetical protein